jgi:hypothetical protein
VTTKRLLPVGALEVTWRLRYQAVPRSPYGFDPTDQWPKNGTACYQHADDLRPHHYGGFRWQLNGGTCELCIVEQLLTGEAVLDRVEEFAAYVESIEAKGRRSTDHAGEHPRLARQVLDAATAEWGAQALEPILRALEVARRHPGRASALRHALAALDGPVPEAPAAIADGATVEIPEPVSVAATTRRLERQSVPAGSMSTELGRARRTRK